MRSLLVTALLMLLAGAAVGGSFLPLHDNAQWTYGNDAGETMTITVTGHALVRGTPCVELRWELPDQAFKNYWTTGRDGSVVLHGAMNEDGGFQAAYSPGILWLPAVEAAQRCWGTSTRMYFELFGDSSHGAPLNIEFCVTGGGAVSTPAGDFETIAVSAATEILPAKDGAGYNAFGRRMTAAKQSESEWFALDVGLVRDDEWELIAYEVVAANEDLAWGAVKALYR